MSRFARTFLERSNQLRSWFRSSLVIATGVRLGHRCKIGPNCQLALGHSKARGGEINIGDDCQIDGGSFLHPYGGKIILGNNVYVGPQTIIYGHGNVLIGDHTLIAMHCSIVSANHSIPAVGTLIRSQPDLPKPIKIGRDVWLGAGCTVLAGVTIGDGAVIAAGAVVTSDIPTCGIAKGIPARVTGERPAPSS